MVRILMKQQTHIRNILIEYYHYFPSGVDRPTILKFFHFSNAFIYFGAVTAKTKLRRIK